MILRFELKLTGRDFKNFLNHPSIKCTTQCWQYQSSEKLNMNLITEINVSEIEREV